MSPVTEAATRCRLLRCANRVEVSPDGSPAVFEVPGVFRGVLRFKSGGGMSSVALRGQFDDAAAPDDGETLWCGVVVGDDEERPFASLGLGARTLAGVLLRLHRLMSGHVRYSLGSGAPPYVVVDAQRVTSRFEVDDAPPDAPLDVDDDKHGAARPQKRCVAGMRGKTVTFAWHTQRVDLAGWKLDLGGWRLFGLRAILGRVVDLSRVWGDEHPVRLVLFSEGLDGARWYYVDLEMRREAVTAVTADAAAASLAASVADDASNAVAALLARDGSCVAYSFAAGETCACVGPAFAETCAATEAVASAGDVVSQLDITRLDVSGVERTRLALCAQLARSPEFAASAGVAAAARWSRCAHLEQLFDSPADASTDAGPVAAVLAVWERGWLCGTFALARNVDEGTPPRVVFEPVCERGGLLCALKATTRTLYASVADVDSVRRCATPRAFSKSKLVFFEFATSARVWSVGVCGSEAAELLTKRLARLSNLARRGRPNATRDRASYVEARTQAPVALHECTATRLVLNAYRVAGTEGLAVADVARQPGLALELVLKAREGLAPLSDALEACSRLRQCPLAHVAALRADDAVAFALNLHHLIIALAQLEGLLRDDDADADKSFYPSVLELSDSLSKCSLVVAGRAASALELEHGVVRKRASQPDTFLRGLLIPTPSCVLPLEAPRPAQIARLGLALHAGIKASGPANVPVYQGAHLERQLTETAAFVAKDSFAQSMNGVRLPAVVRYYTEDYTRGGTNVDAALAVLDFLPKGDVKERLRRLLSRRGGKPAHVYFGDFDVTPQRLRLRQDTPPHTSSE